MLKVLVMGSDVKSEVALLQRLQNLSGLPGDSMALCYDLSACDLLVVSNAGAMPHAARRMLTHRPGLPLWLLDQDGELRDALRAHEDAPIDRERIGHVLRGLHGVEIRQESAPSESFVEAMRARLVAGTGHGVVTVEGNEALLLDFAKGHAVPAALARLPAERFMAWLGASYDLLKLEAASAERFAEAAAHATRLPLAPLLWQTALRMQAEPVLIAPLHAGTALRLRHWPDFRVLGNRHDDFRLCSLLLKRACTSLECSHMLGIDPGAVRAFFNAAYLSGYASAVEAAPAVLPRAPAPAGDRSGSVLASMWRSVRERIRR